MNRLNTARRVSDILGLSDSAADMRSRMLRHTDWGDSGRARGVSHVEPADLPAIILALATSCPAAAVPETVTRLMGLRATVPEEERSALPSWAPLNCEVLGHWMLRALGAHQRAGIARVVRAEMLTFARLEVIDDASVSLVLVPEAAVGLPEVRVGWADVRRALRLGEPERDMWRTTSIGRGAWLTLADLAERLETELVGTDVA